MKIIHTADLHIGAKFVKFGVKGKDLRSQIKNTLEKIVDECISTHVELLLFAGDVFDNPYPSQLDIAFVRGLTDKLSQNNIWTVVLPGNHDRLEDGSVWTENEWGEIPNLYIFNSTENNYYIDSLRTFVYANATFLQFSELSPLHDLAKVIEENKQKHPGTFHVAIGHGNLKITNQQTNFPIEKKEIVDLKSDYLALGDWHSLLLVNSNSKELTEYKYDRFRSPSFYSGSPEIVDTDQKGAGNIIQIDIQPEYVSVRTRKVGKRYVDEMTIQLESIASLEKLIEKMCLSSSLDLIRTVHLDGVAPFEIDTEALKETLSNKFWSIDIIKKFKISKIDLSKLEEGTVMGNFVKSMNDLIAKTPEDQRLQEALTLGIEYLSGLNKQ